MRLSPRTIGLSVVVAATLSGCATHLRLEYRSNPAGAAIYQNDRFVGRAPFTLLYPKAFEDRECFTLPPTKVEWESGATLTVREQRECSSLGNDQWVRFDRPDTPGIEVDLAAASRVNAEEVARLDAQYRARAAASAAFSAGMQNAIQQMGGTGAYHRPAPPPPAYQTPSTSVTANWTGRMEFIQTVTYKQGVNCEYSLYGKTFWKSFARSACPPAIEVE